MSALSPVITVCISLKMESAVGKDGTSQREAPDAEKRLLGPAGGLVVGVAFGLSTTGRLSHWLQRRKLSPNLRELNNEVLSLKIVSGDKVKRGLGGGQCG